MLLRIRQLHNTIINDHLVLKTILIIPSSECDLFETFSACGSLEIGLTKSSYVALFIEVHTFWHRQCMGKAPLVDRQLPDEVMDLYLMTLGLLLTTPENRPALNLHQDLVFLISATDALFLERDFDIATCFLQSRLKRINKSPLLWFWIKKLTILLVLNNLDSHKQQLRFTTLVARTLASFRHHYSNYYAGSFLLWLCHVLNGVSGPNFDSLLVILQKELTQSCRSTLLDVSLWTSLATLAVALETCCEHALDEYYRLGGKKFSEKAGAENRLSTHDFVYSHLKWLLDVECHVETPFRVLINALTNLDAMAEVINNKHPDHNNVFLKRALEQRAN